MEPPAGGQSRTAFTTAIDAHINARYKTIGDDLYCRKCDSIILRQVCSVSIHTSAFPECAGKKVEHIPLPYCPQCEGVSRKTHSCIHEE